MHFYFKILDMFI